MTRRTRVALVFGGRSTEHSVSVISAASVLAVLDRDRYDVVALGITRDGRWVLAPDEPAELTAAPGQLPEVDPGGVPVVLAGDPTVDELVRLTGSPDIGGIDVVFPLLHGPFGEDGTLQGLLELAGLPYVGSGVLSSALAMDKAYMKMVLADSGLPVGPYLVLGPGIRDDRTDAADILGRLGLPVFVKPARGGSSLGIVKVSAEAELVGALAHVRQFDPKLVVEAMVTGREIECGVLDGPAGPEASLPCEITVQGREFYDFEAKYLDEGTRFDIPAPLGPEQTAQVQRMACRAFEALGCEGLARVDFFLGEDGFVVNELNTMPGFTPASMFPRMWAASGVDYPALVDRLVSSALARGVGLR